MGRIPENGGFAEIKELGAYSELIRFDTRGQVMFFPVRHHSPVCSYHLINAIRAYEPEIILIEGPDTADGLIDVLTDPKTVLPAAFYYFYKDRKKLVSEDGGDYKCYYPFLKSSPEYNAMVMARELGIPARFIDLPYSEIIINTAENAGLRTMSEKHSYADDGGLKNNSFYRRLAEKTGLRDFEEFWEKYFETEGLLLSTEKFFVQMHTYCILSRLGMSEEELRSDGTLAREAYMAGRISRAMKDYRRVMAVTGGLHSSGLWERIKRGETDGPKLHKIADDCQGVFPTAYSYEAADALHGYVSGMRYPGFYDTVTERLQGGAEPQKVYDDLCLELLVRTAKECSKRDIPVSIADVASAQSLMKGLAALRNVRQCGICETIDAVVSSFIKGEKTVSSAMPVDIVKKLATGDAVGHIGDKSHVPPLVADFEEQCEKFKLRYRSVVPQETEAALFSAGKGLELSRFLHRTAYLGTNFAQRTKGPDLHTGTDRSRVREEWRYKRTPEVDAVLTDRTTDGSTIEEACRTYARRVLRTERRCCAAAQTEVDCFLMGISLGDEGRELMEEILAGDGDFFSVGGGLGCFETLYSLQQLYRFEEPLTVTYLRRCLARLIASLPSMAAAPSERAGECVGIMKRIYGITDGLVKEEREAFREALCTLCGAKDKESEVYGGAMGLLYAMDNSRRDMAEAAMMGYLRGTPEVRKKGSGFLKGLFATARDIVMADDTFLKMTDELITVMDREEFMEVLPAMKLAFSYFTPAEIQQTARAAAMLHGVDEMDILYSEALNEGLIEVGSRLDKEVMKILKEEDGLE
ncbi:MAG: hypothetical protein IJ806_11875 [Ruminococcus sp.]|nr:hypothetical protein [Ruminococcus sp.]